MYIYIYIYIYIHIYIYAYIGGRGVVMCVPFRDARVGRPYLSVGCGSDASGSTSRGVSRVHR
jgi:hypothetical protein